MSDICDSLTVPCLLDTWHLTESELYYWLLKQSANQDIAFDLLQETFLRALQQKKAFCDIKNQRSWLFRVARNLYVDMLRQSKRLSYDDGLLLSAYADTTEEQPVVDSLAQCLPIALKQLSPADQNIIEACDLKGMAQQQFANQHGLSLSATKSRIQRARNKLKLTLKKQCQIRLDEQQRVCCYVPKTSS
ncbi:sigma-70 family RNA polymerase sigma factor [Agarivorans sp. MS3-6]